MSSETNTPAGPKPGFFSRMFGGIRARIRRIFGKDEAPNIYPFF